VIYGSITAAWLVLMIVFIVIGSTRRANFNQAQNEAAEAIAQQQTQAAQVQTDQAGTEVALETAAAFEVAATQTVVALTATEPTGGVVVEGRPTLPPTFTPTDAPEAAPGIGPTSTPLALPPADQFADAVLVGWGGIDRLNNDFRPIFAYSLGAGTERQLTDFLVSSVQLNPANGQELLFTRFFPETFDFNVGISNLSGQTEQRIAEAWEPLDFIIELEQVSYSPDGSKLAFIAPTTDNGTTEIYFLDLNFAPNPGVSPLRRITRDEANYSFPAISPDNTRILAIRENPQDLDPGPDLVVIEVDGGLQTILKQDASATTEERPAWVLPDGNEIVYAGRVENSPEATFDLIRLNPNNPSAPAQFEVRSPSFNASYPVISPDGRYLAYASDQTGEWNIFILNRETGETYQLTNDNEAPNYPGGWYVPGSVTSRPQTIIATPVPGGGGG
jgi:hypothetical protein